MEAASPTFNAFAQWDAFDSVETMSTNSEIITSVIFPITENPFDLTSVSESPCEVIFSFDVPISDKMYNEGDSDIFTHSEATFNCNGISLNYQLQDQATSAMPAFMSYDQSLKQITVSNAV